LTSLLTEVTKVDILSDNCGGQNKNIQIMAICMYAVKNIDHLVEITHTFLETGHTHMECDSMHAAIEFAKKNVKVHSIGHWEGILSSARRNKPYEVYRLQNSSFFYLKALVHETIVNKMKDVEGNVVNWRSVRSLRYHSSSGSIVEYKNDLQEEFRILDLSASRRARPSSKDTGLKQKYKNQLPISKAKKDDLLDLCKQNVIHADYHGWYKDLPVASNVIDKVPLPSINEDSSTED